MSVEPPGRQHSGCRNVVVDRQADLLEIVGAGNAPGGLARSLDRGKKQRNENRNDGDHDQQFDQGKRTARAHIGLSV